ncbi:MAG TPA: hypothetical protein VGE35_04295 [Candidatus Paceibacterota bacterium]
MESNPIQKPEKKSTVILRGIMYTSTASVLLMDLWPDQFGRISLTYWVYALLAIPIVFAEWYIRREKKDPWMW